MKENIKSTPAPMVQTFHICQANTHVFRDLYMYTTMFVLVLSGSKRVVQSTDEGIKIRPGELLIFPSGSFITIENRIISGGDYQAFCVSYPDELIDRVFNMKTRHADKSKALHITALPAGLIEMIRALPESTSNKSIPEALRLNKALEPLVWLQSMEIMLKTPNDKRIDCKLRDLISGAPDRKWRINDVASAFGYSEATLRRKLTECGTSFSEIVTNVRLECGLTMLQTTNLPISTIALESGFSTPSHFSDIFKQRFHIQPKHIRDPSH
jgi:AraC-like DNA-binding protein